MKILVTGGAGFIASHIADAFIEEGHTVFIFDNLSSGFEKNVNPKAEFINKISGISHFQNYSIKKSLM